MEKQLLACSEDEVCAAVNTLQHSVLEFHCESSFGPTHRRERTAQIVAHKCVILAPSISTANPGFGPPHREGVRDTAYEKAFRTMNAMIARLISA